VEVRVDSELLMDRCCWNWMGLVSSSGLKRSVGHLWDGKVGIGVVIEGGLGWVEWKREGETSVRAGLRLDW